METGQIINKISHRLRRRSQAVQKSLGISEAQGRILNYILVESQKRPVYPNELEKEFGLRSSTVTETLTGLENAGLIQRIPDPADKRRKTIVFTEKAESIREALQNEIEGTEKLLLKDISGEDQALFLHIGRQMLENLDSAEPGQKKQIIRKNR